MTLIARDADSMPLRGRNGLGPPDASYEMKTAAGGNTTILGSGVRTDAGGEVGYMQITIFGKPVAFAVDAPAVLPASASLTLTNGEMVYQDKPVFMKLPTGFGDVRLIWPSANIEIMLTFWRVK